MKTFFDCLPCLVEQTRDACRMATEDVWIHERVLRRVLQRSSEWSFERSPPEMGREIHRIITSLARRGVSILLVSSELPELMALAHRIGVMRQGRLVAERNARTATEEDLRYLPTMRTDVSLESSTRHIVIDAKYYSKTLQTYFGTDTIHSGNLYQLYAYLKNLQV